MCSANLFESNCPTQLKQLHSFINEAYYSLVFSDKEDRFNNREFIQFKNVESSWIEREKKYCLSQFDCDQPIESDEIVKKALESHPVANHVLFDYLQYQANLFELKKFIYNESILNLEFFDYLAFSIIGAKDLAKSEIASNLWDEAGRGSIEKFHTVLFSRLMKDLNLEYDRNKVLESMSWEGIAGINLFNYFAIYSFNKTKYFGMLAATEMLDPPHYNKLIKGISRIFPKQDIDYSYYSEHEAIDVIHAGGWLNNVILPELSKNPHKTREFWLGFYMRLESTKRYYDNLLHLFTIKKAA